MQIIPNGPRSKTDRKEMVNFTASTPEDKEALRALYDLFHKLGSHEILISLAGSKFVGEEIQQISLIFE